MTRCTSSAAPYGERKEWSEMRSRLPRLHDLGMRRTLAEADRAVR